MLQQCIKIKGRHFRAPENRFGHIWIGVPDRRLNWFCEDN